jgi:hypothetical protein
MTMEQIISGAMCESAELRRLWAEWVHGMMAKGHDEEPDEAA